MDSPAKVMQTTLDLSDHLMQQLKQRALQQGRLCMAHLGLHCSPRPAQHQTRTLLR